MKRLVLYTKPKNKDFTSETDPFGSYTGNSIDGEVPEQDADDL